MNPFHRFRESHLSPLEIRFWREVGTFKFFSHIDHFRECQYFLTRAIHSIIPVTKISLRFHCIPRTKIRKKKDLINSKDRTRLIQRWTRKRRKRNNSFARVSQALTASRISRALDSFRSRRSFVSPPVSTLQKFHQHPRNSCVDNLPSTRVTFRQPRPEIHPIHAVAQVSR